MSFVLFFMVLAPGSLVKYLFRKSKIVALFNLLKFNSRMYQSKVQHFVLYIYECSNQGQQEYILSV